MSETWTEYAVRWGEGKFIHFDSREHADQALAALGAAGASEGASVVGRQVTASDWLPVTDGGAA